MLLTESYILLFSKTVLTGRKVNDRQAMQHKDGHQAHNIDTLSP